MALTKKDLQDIEVLLEKHLQAGLAPVNTRLDSLEGTTKTLVDDVTGLKDTVVDLKHTVTGLKYTVSGLQHTMKDFEETQKTLVADVANLKSAVEDNTNMQKALCADVAYFNQAIVPSVDLLLDHFKGVIDSEKRIEKVEAVQEDHGYRIWAIERKLKAN